jgi:hypothetical protein
LTSTPLPWGAAPAAIRLRGSPAYRRVSAFHQHVLVGPWSRRVNKVTRNWLANDIDLDAIRDEPRFKALLRPAE